MSTKLLPLSKYMSDALYKKILDSLPVDFYLDQFAISFIHFFPDNQIIILINSNYDDIKRYLHRYVLGKTIQNKLHLAKKMIKYSGEEYWTKNLNKESIMIQR